VFELISQAGLGSSWHTGSYPNGAVMFAPPIAKAQTRAAASSVHKAAQQRSEPAPCWWNELGGPREKTAGLAVERMRLPNQAPRPTGSWDFAKIPIVPPGRTGPAHSAASLPGVIQRKLAIGRVDDPLEHEANRVADRVMRMPDPEISTTSAPLQISRKCAACEEEETVRKKPAGKAEIAANEAPGTVREILRSPGQPLDASSLAYFEPRFGHDFSGLRVHTGAAAERSAQDVNAHAYTVGLHLVFGAGRFAPRTGEGRRLIAHELAHVVQQGGLGRTGLPARSGSRATVTSVQPGTNGTPITSRQRPVVVARPSAPLIQRQPSPPVIKPAGKDPADPVLSRAEEIRQSSTSVGQITYGLNPPMISFYNFAIGQPTLKAEHAAGLKALAAVLKRAAGAKLYITANGHADSSGEADINIPLSRRRAITVQNLLQQESGVAVDPSWFGASAPATANDTVDGRSRNRRVDIYLRAPGGVPRKPEDKPKDKKPPPKKPEKDDTHDGGGGGDGWDWSLPSPCGGLLGALFCGIVACAAFFELCLFCLQNPEVCLGSLTTKDKQKDKKKPKDKFQERPCVDTCDLPLEKTIPARELLHSPHGAWLAAPFNMHIVFKNDDTGCSCRLGEYIQEIKGFAERDHGTGTMVPANPAGLTLGPGIDYQEDVRGGRWHYGIRSELIGKYRRRLIFGPTFTFVQPRDRLHVHGFGYSWHAKWPAWRTYALPLRLPWPPVDRRNRAMQLDSWTWREWSVDGDWVVPYEA
jgi:outer membrane protein OmpA-like peptidoglycan-associated protein